MADDLRIVMAGLDAPVNSLSGGNAQKVVLGKWLLRTPTLLLLNDPTKGVDVGAKAEIYRLLAELRSQGTAILFYCSDDEELLGLCDRVLVLHDGQVRAELAGDTLTRTNLIAASVGGSAAPSPGQRSACMSGSRLQRTLRKHPYLLTLLLLRSRWSSTASCRTTCSSRACSTATFAPCCR